MSSTDSDPRCLHKTANGKRCRMLRATDHPHYCSHHAGWLQHDEPPEDLASELLGPFGDLRTAAAINYAIGRLVILVARRRISTREAGTLGYLYQLGLQSIYAMEYETAKIRGDRVGGAEDLRRVLEHSVLMRGEDN